MEQMPESQWRAFLAEGTRTGHLATTTSGGAPTVVPIWFLVEDDALVFTTWHESAKAKNLARDPRAALTVDNGAHPYRFVLVRGTVSYEERSPELASYARRLAERYMPADEVAFTAERNAVEGEWLCRLSLDRVLAPAEV